VADNSADFVGRESRIDRHGEVMQPEFRFEISGPDVDMRRFAALVRIEECAIRSLAQNSRHSILVVRKRDGLPFSDANQVQR
jgi:hypothetical protein